MEAAYFGEHDNRGSLGLMVGDCVGVCGCEADSSCETDSAREADSGCEACEKLRRSYCEADSADSSVGMRVVPLAIMAAAHLPLNAWMAVKHGCLYLW